MDLVGFAKPLRANGWPRAHPGRESRAGAFKHNAGLFAFGDRLATMTFPLAVRRPKNVVL